MKRNMSGLDRGVRIILAILFITLYFAKVVSGVSGAILVVVGIIFLLTAVLGFCPIYGVFGMHSNKKDEEHEHEHA